MSVSQKFRIFVLSFVMLSITPSLLYGIASDDEVTFSEYEIRVIRPKYFIKRSKMELGVQASLIMNNSFVYTGMANVSAGFHFNESLGVEVAGSIGASIDKEDKDTLLGTFLIRTDIKRTFFTALASLMYTPAYGKIQLPKGRLIYFDTFLSAGGGMTGINWKYSDFCKQDDSTSTAEIKEDAIGSYPSFVGGVGQRIFYSRTDALRWDLKWNAVFYSNQDASCWVDTQDEGNSLYNNVLLQLGWSRFF